MTLFKMPRWLVLIACLAGCQPPDPPAQSASSQGGVIDSILPMDVALDRFREGLTPRVGFTNAASSREALVSGFLVALARNDTASLREMVLDRAEYAWLYFPASPYMRKPYALPPDIAWSLNLQNSEKGLGRLLQRLGGSRLEPGTLSCPDSLVEEANTFWKDCLIAYAHRGSSARVERRLFGAIMRHRAQFKFLSYANDF